ncbi:dihydrolipoamide dehydrogenase [Rhodomicrobium udaipurense JA643]|uniref:FAD-dependent oxidoreductase n=1 Tax=Rhodomicrobium udaipurense TaxID=1202716 RepID=A0A8I1GFR9_9HYPH|nr:FAD-dependent oxidoreductase [Rhodomicrobium udaipurense]KAI93231.1 dihydrolipoamide dehydrogenase [Rhodomicrobium udaipurense JA643]MBJ7543046.1 FAD-dependent oxidoreductase [Rhodomicrobium udaipurense]
MPQLLTPDICVIGAGSGGLSAAAIAAAFGVSVVLIERGPMGGECLNTGCVPSKALLAAAKRAHQIRDAEKFGIRVGNPGIDHKAVAEHVAGVVAAIAPNDSVERFNGLGVDVIKASARFVDPDIVEAADYQIKARRFVIATGSAPLIPPIPVLDRVPFFTNETIFQNTHRLPQLIILGGGPAGLELAQAHKRLGSEVTVVEAGKALSRDDDELRQYLLNRLRDEGIRVQENARVERIEPFGNNIRVVFANLGRTYSIEGTHLLLAVGRAPVVADLNLEAAGIDYSERGIQVTSGLRTSNKRVYAIGDVTGEVNLTHAANYHASIVIKNALFRLPAKADHSTIPWVTFTDPEVAHVGLTEDAARARYGKLAILRWPYAENDRAQAERETGGFVKVIASRRGKILGAGIVGAQAGELIQMWSLAMQKGISLKAMQSIVSPYPTLSEMNKRAALNYFAPSAQNPFLRRIIALLAKFR